MGFNMNFEYHVPPSIIYGKGSRFKAAEHCSALSLKNLLIVSDKYLEQAGLVAGITDCLEAAGLGYAVFTDIPGEPTTTDVENALDALKRNKCDGILSIGGGSALDTAKSVAVMATNPGTISDYMGYHKVKTASLPLIAIPTTAGTGSEVTRVVVITDAGRDVKMMCLDNAFMADIAIVDYELSMTMPKSLTAFVGMDALTHAIEAYVSAKANPVSDMFALLGMELISANILAAYNEPENEAARESMMIGANYAGIAFSNASVCTVHGMSRPIGAYFHIAHGLSNAMLLPIVTEYSIEGNASRYASVARHIGYDPGLPCETLAQKVVEKLREFNTLLRIPNLSEYGVDKAKYDSVIMDMVDAAIASGSPGNNPKVFTPDEMSEIYEKAYTYK